MKIIPPSCPTPDTGPKYWRSLDDLAETPEFRQFVEREFPTGAAELKDPVTRRSFVKLMSASFLLAGFGLTGCRKPEEKIYPFSKMPEGYTHGVAKYYATSMPVRRSAVPLLAKSNDGRPTKLEGNPGHPDSNGSTDRFTQAAILDLYDPDRAIRYTQNGSITSLASVTDFLGKFSKDALANGGKGLSFLATQSSSPSRARLQKLIAEKLPQSKWYEHEPVDFDIHRQAATAAFGQSVAPYFKIDEASVIVALDSDFIGNEEHLCNNIRGFAKGRRTKKADDPMNRLYAVEAMMTLTGANADHRLRLAPSAVPAFTASLLVQILGSQGNLASAVQSLADSFKGDINWVKGCAADLIANKGKSLVLAGQRQPLAVHLMAHAINAALENVGKTIVLLPVPESAAAGSIADLAKALDAGSVETLVVLGGNPAYDAPADLKWNETLAKSKVQTVIRLGYYEDETFSRTGWNLPLAHFLESWGDARTADGTVVSIQPLIEPLFEGMTELELLARILGQEKTDPCNIARETFRALPGGADEEKWKKFLHDGYLTDSAAKPVDAPAGAAVMSAVTAAISSALPTPASAPAKDKLEVVFHRDYRMDDGRFNNNGWLQELPDPITKMTWENVILMSVKTAEELGLADAARDAADHDRALSPWNGENNRIKAPWVKIQLDGREIEGPVWAQPGQADYTIALALGYGRAQTGRIGSGSGYNAYALRTTKNLHCATGAKLSDTGNTHPLSVTQDHGAMEGRPIIREANLAQYRKFKEENPNGNIAKGYDLETPLLNLPSQTPDQLSLYPNPFLEAKKTGHHQWGMSIDLSACVGCSSCMVACQSENNVPIVGKGQVANNREMHWLRIDRYFTGSPADPQIINQPMLCQHCEAAPCENVCPVNATTHDQEGLNVMVYNRCVGTRYCANNCPYKVRRFNFFDYNRRTLKQLNGKDVPVLGTTYSTPLLPGGEQRGVLDWLKDPDRGNKPNDEWELLKLVKNPDVTVRMRGVMEKCTYCIQRIQGAEIAQKVKAGATADVIVPDGTFKTACQQACPAEAIVFGNTADPESQVSIHKAVDRNYSVLDFLNTRPRTTYLARIRNPNPNMPDQITDAKHPEPMPNSTWEFEDKNGIKPFEVEHAHTEAGKGAA
jgi:MoCo/4Fe-4S cofactor protein with predicted Tat translocation signal